jgi:chemotaxis protein MotA
MEGGSLSDITQITAAMIVVGGTLGAVMITTPLHILKGTSRELVSVFFEKGRTPQDVKEEILVFAVKARKHGIISLESDLDHVADPFLRKALTMAVDGMELKELRTMMELDINIEAERREAEAKVLEAAGGYAPTVGILGAVLGLIQVMKHLENIEEVGRGIAVAFVATIYGVGMANLLLLPASGKIKARVHENVLLRELMLEGVCAILEGSNPKMIEAKLDGFCEAPQQAKGKPGKKGVPVGQPVSAKG